MAKHMRGAGPPPPFAPNDLSGLVLWLEGDYHAKDAGGADASDAEAVATWTDRSAGARHLVQASVPLQPLYRATGLGGTMPALEFDGNNDLLYHAGVATTSLTFTLFAVLQRTAEVGGQIVFHNGDLVGGDGYGFEYGWDGTTRVVLFRSVIICADGISGTAPELWAARRDATPELTLRINGVGQTLSDTTTAPSTPTTGIWIGQGGVFNSLAGMVAAIVFYDTALSDGDRGLVEGYLAGKYGISL